MLGRDDMLFVLRVFVTNFQETNDQSSRRAALRSATVRGPVSSLVVRGAERSAYAIETRQQGARQKEYADAQRMSLEARPSEERDEKVCGPQKRACTGEPSLYRWREVDAHSRQNQSGAGKEKDGHDQPFYELQCPAHLSAPTYARTAFACAERPLSDCFS